VSRAFCLEATGPLLLRVESRIDDTDGFTLVPPHHLSDHIFSGPSIEY
jgi:hypothetical protein